MLGIIVKDPLQASFGTEVAHASARLLGLVLEPPGHCLETFFTAYRSPGHHPHAFRGYETDDRLPIGAEPILNSRVYDLERCGIPAVSENNLSGTFN
jgi:hypothetical protein